MHLGTLALIALSIIGLVLLVASNQTKQRCLCAEPADPDFPAFDVWSPGHPFPTHDWPEMYYDRDGHPISLAQWVWQRQADPGHKIVRHTHNGETLISTVWLGMDHNFGDGPPVIFESMVFNVDGWQDFQDRYTTEADATAGHERIVAAIANRLTADEYV